MLLSDEEKALNATGISVLRDISKEEIQACQNLDELLELFACHGAYLEHQERETI